MKVSKVKDLTKSINFSVTPRMSSSPWRRWFGRSGFSVFLLSLKRLRRNHEETSMEGAGPPPSSGTAKVKRATNLLRNADRVLPSLSYYGSNLKTHLFWAFGPNFLTTVRSHVPVKLFSFLFIYFN